MAIYNYVYSGYSLWDDDLETVHVDNAFFCLQNI